MKKLFTLFVIIPLTISVFAQSPQKMSYQAVVRNTSGVLQANQPVGMKISILQGTATGTAVYVETHTTTTNANGLATIEIGGGTIVTGTFTGINWSGGTYFIKTETDPAGGTNYTITGTSQILSVPYALYAKTAKTADYNDLTNKPSLFDGTWTSLTGKPSFATVSTSGSYNDLTNKPTLFDGTWTNITGKPTTLTGYGITDGISISHATYGITSTMITNWNTAFGWGNHSGLYKLNSYVPAWSEITGKPTFAAVATSGTFADILSKPTNLAGYGITNAMSTSHAANNITSTMMTNWNTAFGWGNHAGLYRPITYVPAWSEITSKPTTLSGYGIIDAVRTSGTQEITGKTTFKGTTPDMEQALFEIKNKDGQIIFAVYNEGVRIWVADGAKGTKGGFAVQGFDMTTDYMVIKPDSANFYVREGTKGVASSFNIIGVKQSLPRKSLMFARTDTVSVSGVMNLQNNLIVQGNIDLTGTINTVSDIEGNSYKTVVIGSQVWMAENLKTTKYNDGTAIANVSDSATWIARTTGAYCDYNNTPTTSTTYGKMYNWYAVDNNAATKAASNGGKNICPTGWHVPTEVEWETMESYLSYNGFNYDGTIGDVPAKISKSLSSSTLWKTSTVAGAPGNTDYPAFINKTGFTALPGGIRSINNFRLIEYQGYWWVTTDGGGGNAWGHAITSSTTQVHEGNNPKYLGYSVRCLKD